MLIINSIKILLDVQKHKDYIDKYVREKFYQSNQYLQFKLIKSGVWCGFKDYQLLSENRIEISYEYGFSDSVYTDKFEIDIQEDIRQQNIDQILNN